MISNLYSKVRDNLTSYTLGLLSGFILAGAWKIIFFIAFDWYCRDGCH